MFKSRKAKSNAMNHASPILLTLMDQALSRNIVLDIYWICLPRMVSSVTTVGTSIPVISSDAMLYGVYLPLKTIVRYYIESSCIFY